MWMVRAGEGGFLFDEFKTRNVVAIGWNKLGDLANAKNNDEIKDKLIKTYEYTSGKLANVTGQLSRFRFDLKIADHVITYDSVTRKYLVGQISSDYKYDNSLSEYYHSRKVTWAGEISRDTLSSSTRNSLGSTLTLFKPSSEAETEILATLNEKQINNTIQQTTTLAQPDDSLDEIKNDIVEKAHEFIKDKILSIDWEEMQELVAGLLRAMGYKTHISAKGPDQGRDIIASPDGLGLEEPRIVVEVKHRDGTMGADKIRGFVGGLRAGDKGLYVSTGGFTKEAKYEADRSNIPLNLVDSDMLVNLIIQYYDTFDSDAKSLIPLRKIYWPA